MRRLAGCVLAAVLALAPTATAQESSVPGRLLPPLLLGPGVVQRDFTATGVAGEVMGHLIEVELLNPAVSTDLLTPGAVAARAPLAAMADARDAVAGINGDFFDIEGTGAAYGPAVAGSLPLQSAVPTSRRLAPPLPTGTTADAVFAVGSTRQARVDRLTLDAQVVGPRNTARVDGLNQHALPVDGIGLFTPVWGTASRAGAPCDAPGSCSPRVREVSIRGGVVSAVRDRPGAGPIAPDELVLLGRDAGADALADLLPGDRVDVPYRLLPEDFQFAVGGTPVLRDGQPYSDLDNRERAPRSAAGASADGFRMYLVTVDGRQADSVGATLAEFATLLDDLGVDDAVNLDGGGSSTLVYRKPGAGSVTVVNDPSDPAARAVPNGIGVFTGP